MDCIVKNGTLVIPHTGVIEADLGIEAGKIVAIDRSLGAPKAGKTIDATGTYVFPGLVDPHVHLGNWYPFLEDARTETRSAAAGGVTTFLTNLKVGIFDETFPSYKEVFPNILDLTKGLSAVDYSFHFHVPTDRHMEEIPDYYREFGVQSFKFHMGYKPRAERPGIADVAVKLKKISPGLDDGLIYLILRKIGQMEDQPLAMVHAECDEIIEKMTDEAVQKGLQGLAGWDAARPDFAEAQAIVRATFMARITNSNIYIVHLSSAKGLEVIREEKRRGTKVIAETCTHYLSLTTDLRGTFGKVAPPIRSRANVDALWQGVIDGTITCLGTDHSPKPRESRVPDIWQTSLGFPSMEMSLPILLHEGRQRGVPLTTLAELSSYNNARTFRLFPRKGTIAVGSDADLVLVDLQKRVKIGPEHSFSVAGFSPYEGIEVQGWPVMTILRGEVIFQDGQVVKEAMGEFIPRYPASRRR